MCNNTYIDSITSLDHNCSSVYVRHADHADRSDWEILQRKRLFGSAITNHDGLQPSFLAMFVSVGLFGVIPATKAANHFAPSCPKILYISPYGY
jgi:hypothetical protein